MHMCINPHVHCMCESCTLNKFDWVYQHEGSNDIQGHHKVVIISRLKEGDQICKHGFGKEKESNHNQTG